MNLKFNGIFFWLVIMSLVQGCDMGTRMYLQVNLGKPVPDRCIEDVLTSKPGISFRKNPASQNMISSYSFMAQEFGGGVHQERNDDGRIILDIGSIWIGEPRSLEKERQEELYFRELFTSLEANCNQLEFKNVRCMYSSFYSSEKRCPSARNSPTPN